MSKKTNIVNLGCRLNIYEGAIIKNHLGNHKLTNITIIKFSTENYNKNVNYGENKCNGTLTMLLFN